MQLRSKIWNSEDSIDIFDYQNSEYINGKHYLTKNCDIFIDKYNDIKISTEKKEIDLKNYHYLLSLNRKGDDYFLTQNQNFKEIKDKIYFSLTNYVSSNGDKVRNLRDFIQYLIRIIF